MPRREMENVVEVANAETENQVYEGRNYRMHTSRGVRAARAERARKSDEGAMETVAIVRHEREKCDKRRARTRERGVDVYKRLKRRKRTPKREDDEVHARFLAHAQHELCTVAGDE